MASVRDLAKIQESKVGWLRFWADPRESQPPAKTQKRGSVLPQRLPASSEGIPSRSATLGYAQLPNSVVENQSLLANAELRFLIIVCRRGPEKTCSDRNWEDWTGLDPKMKTHAIRGLREKGLHVRGRGNTAKFSFDRGTWDSWVRTRPRHERARTVGRSKTVTAQPGMQIHQECRERGCGRLCEGEKIVSIDSVVSEPNRKPVSNSPPGFPLTLAKIQGYFPSAGQEFIDLLIPAVSRKVPEFTDSQLAQAVESARKRNQHSEGLFLQTVPNALAVILSRPPVPGTRTQPAITIQQIQAHLSLCAAALRKGGMNDIAGSLEASEIGDLQQFEAHLESLEAKVLDRLRGRFAIATFKAQIDKELKPYREKMTKDQLTRLEKQFLDRQMMEAAGIPRLSLLV